MNNTKNEDDISIPVEEVTTSTNNNNNNTFHQRTLNRLQFLLSEFFGVSPHHPELHTKIQKYIDYGFVNSTTYREVSPEEGWKLIAQKLYKDHQITLFDEYYQFAEQAHERNDAMMRDESRKTMMKRNNKSGDGSMNNSQNLGQEDGENDEANPNQSNNNKDETSSSATSNITGAHHSHRKGRSGNGGRMTTMFGGVVSALDAV